MVTLLSIAPAAAQEPESGATAEDDATELAKASQNPVSDLVRVPLLFNFYSGDGRGDRSLFVLEIEPIIPMQVYEGWNVIARPTIPVLDVPDDDGDGDAGLGDLVVELLAAPSPGSAFMWGVGPVFSFPTSTLDATATGSWGLGPAGAAVYAAGPWVVGARASQIWTIVDYGDDREVELLTIEPFVHFNFGKGWAVATAPTITANWDAEDEWTVPLGGGVTWTTKIGRQAMNLGVHYYYNIERPELAGKNQLRFEISFLFPRREAAAPAVAVSSGKAP